MAAVPLAARAIVDTGARPASTLRIAAMLAATLTAPALAGANDAVCHPTPRGPPPLPARAGYERDHVIPLCLGGPDTAANMQYQAWAEARVKDRLEARVCHLVCDLRAMPLEEAQNGFRADWRALYRQVFGAEP
jgi:hypothetical protein